MVGKKNIVDDLYILSRILRVQKRKIGFATEQWSTDYPWKL